MSFLEQQLINVTISGETAVYIVIKSLTYDSYIIQNENTIDPPLAIYKSLISKQWKLYGESNISIEIDTVFDKPSTGQATAIASGAYDNNEHAALAFFPNKDIRDYQVTHNLFANVTMPRFYRNLIQTIKYSETRRPWHYITSDTHDLSYDENSTDENKMMKLLYLYNRGISPEIGYLKEGISMLPTPAYLQLQLEYFENLSARQLACIRLYSRNGDTVLNKYIRNDFRLNKEITDYIAEKWAAFVKYYVYIENMYKSGINFHEFILQTFYEELQLLISRAPPVDRNFILYRGSFTKDHFNGVHNNLYKNKGIASCSTDIDISLMFADIGGFVSRIIIPEGTKCLFMLNSEFLDEKEVILPDKSFYYITKRFQPVKYGYDFDKNIAATTIYELETNELIFIEN